MLPCISGLRTSYETIKHTFLSPTGQANSFYTVHPGVSYLLVFILRSAARDKEGMHIRPVRPSDLEPLHILYNSLTMLMPQHLVVGGEQFASELTITCYQEDEFWEKDAHLIVNHHRIIGTIPLTNAIPV